MKKVFSANVIAAYYHDHIFVPTEKAALAIEALNELANGLSAVIDVQSLFKLR